MPPASSSAENTGRATRDALTYAVGTPPSSARRTASSLYRMRPPASAMQPCTSSLARTSVAGSFGSASSPGTLERMISARAPTATARADATASASTFTSTPSSVTAGGHTTGT